MNDLFRNRLSLRLFLSAILYLIACGMFGGSLNDPQKRGQTQGSGVAHSTLLNINDVSMWIADDGRMERRPDDLSAGVSFPKGTSTIVHAGGLVWGGKVRDSIAPLVRIGGQTFNVGTVPGRIVKPGIPDNPLSPSVRVYRIRRDWAAANLTQDASEVFGIPLIDVTENDVQTLRDRYQRDWIEWPWQYGAPYYERNGQPGYQPNPAGAVDSVTDEPGLGDADEVVWFVANDLDDASTRALYGSPPIGIEMQVTCWAYNHIQNLRNVIFERYRFVYKGAATTPSTAVVESMYVAKWIDPDIGEFSDDYAGCIPGRSVGYAYNASAIDAEYSKYNLVPPVVAYDLLQGPRVRKSGAEAHWNLSTVSDYENLPMTSFTYFTQGTSNADYNLGNYTGSLEWWNILRGYKPNLVNPPQCMLNPFDNSCTNFELSGAAESMHGWIDGVQIPAGDRRIVLSSGPFTLAFGDTQEVVVGLIAGIGKDNRDGINVIKGIDDAAQDAFNFDFDFPVPPPAPSVRIVEMENQIVLDWESDTATTRRIESYNSRGYKFETYTIYQFLTQNPKPGQGIVYQQFDPAQPRYVIVTEDKLRNQALVNGQRYYFAVTSTGYNPDPAIAQQQIESRLIIQQAVPHTPNPGDVYPYTIGDGLSDVVNIVGINDAAVNVSWFDPSKANGHAYKILFHQAGDPIVFVEEKPTWDLIDSTVNDTLLRRAISDSPPQRIITRGFSLQVMQPYLGMKGVFEVLSNYQPCRNIVFNQPNPGENYMIVAPGASQVDAIVGQNGRDRDVEIRFTGDSSWALFRKETAPESYWVRVPYTAWQVGKVGNDSINKQIYTTIDEFGADSVWRTGITFPRTFNGESLRVFYPVTLINESTRVINTNEELQNDTSYYLGTYYDDVPTRGSEDTIRTILWLDGQSRMSHIAVERAYFADLDHNGIAAPRGTIIRFERNKVVYDGDAKLFRVKTILTGDTNAARQEVGRVNVFPNPYYGMNRYETDRQQRFVTFSHLPQIATIRIFNLAGVLVKTIRKDDATQFARWDLNNENGLPAAGGLYLAYLELRDKSGVDLGEKTLKLMLVPEDQTPER